MLRQQALAGGAGGSRVALKRLAVSAAAEAGGAAADGASAGAGVKAGKGGAGRPPKGAVGYEGEDVVSGRTGEGRHMQGRGRGRQQPCCVG